MGHQKAKIVYLDINSTSYSFYFKIVPLDSRNVREKRKDLPDKIAAHLPIWSHSE